MYRIVPRTEIGLPAVVRSSNGRPRPPLHLEATITNYQAGHSAGENSSSFGVLFLNAVREPFNCVQINKYRWLRDVLIWTQNLTPNPDQLPHKKMPGANTDCPGTLGMRAMPELVKPFHQ